MKLSDNGSKVLGPAGEVERYRRIFGVEGIAHTPVLT